MSASEELAWGSMKLWLLLRDMVAAVMVAQRFKGEGADSATAGCYRICIDEAEV